jgi:hypothetical protein
VESDPACGAVDRYHRVLDLRVGCRHAIRRLHGVASKNLASSRQSSLDGAAVAQAAARAVGRVDGSRRTRAGMIPTSLLGALSHRNPTPVACVMRTLASLVAIIQGFNGFTVKGFVANGVTSVAEPHVEVATPQ